ncbi:hypothetical protein [Kribbella jiaozuonensis]|uniref:Uncharacterized protein n=1 Tax=Kribbella jiaozuonensis TaxID=2575441 RepID=A0A4U3M2N0_9ACTN|nr:hypothetical protein [Kribbella jiaozuonensis]TKK82432.1 hypothetical protein FDA38_06495 [Kribbella jiaozuonensis]
MTNLHDSLPDLMRRATEDLQPATPELVARGIRRGKVLRHRRTALAGLSGAAAVLATVGIILGSTQLLQHDAAPTVEPAGTPSSHRSTPSTPAETLAELLPQSLHRGHTTTSEDGTLSVVLDDGRGAGLLTVDLMTAQANTNCNGSPAGTCTVEPDGTVYVAYANRPLYADQQNPGGITVTTVELFYRDGRQISISNYNAPKDEGVEHSRPAPILSIAQLTQIARSKLWVYPPRVS